MNRELLNQELSKIEKPAGISNPKDFRNEVVKFTRERGLVARRKKPVMDELPKKYREVIERRMFSQAENLLPVISFGSRSV